MINLGEETRGILYDYGYTISDINWIGCEDFQIDINDFFKCADTFNYNNGFGHAYVASDLKIVMNDGTWFERCEYDGSESWIHKGVLRKPTTFKRFKSFNQNCYWPLLSEFVEE